MKRILVADDSVTIQKVIALTFADEPFEVQSVGTGSEALELVKSWNPDIVLADVIMPQMNGYELCKAVKQQEGSSAVPVLLLAGTFEAFDEEEAKSVGADGFITKPFESGELIEKVRSLLGEGVPAAPAEAAPAPVTEDLPVPVVEDAPVSPAAAAEPGVVPQAEEAAPAGDTAEPDIWDILSETGDEAASADSPASGFGPIEGAGVVDVGSFDVGIGRPESQPPPPQAPPEPPEAVQTIPVPPVPDPEQDMDEKSRVENMEKDFFGFETGAVEEVSGTDILDDAVEEVTFEMEQPEAAQEADPQEVSFVVPEPAADQPVVTGDTISPDLMAPGTLPDQSPEQVEEVQSIPVSEVDTGAADEPEAAAIQPAAIPVQEPVPVEVPVPESIEISGFAPEPVAVPEPVPEQPPEVAPEPVPEPPAPMEMDAQPDPEPPLELPVELTQDLPAEFSPEPITPPIAEEAVAEPEELPADIPADPVPEPFPTAPAGAQAGVPDDEAIRKMVEEKVEKIAWEVVPEMAEVIIREAIQKIKDGS